MRFSPLKVKCVTDTLWLARIALPGDCDSDTDFKEKGNW